MNVTRVKKQRKTYAHRISVFISVLISALISVYKMTRKLISRLGQLINDLDSL